MIARSQFVNIAAEMGNVPFLDPVKVTLPIQGAPEALGVQLEGNAFGDQWMDILRRIPVGMGDYNLYLPQVVQPVQRVPDGFRPMIKRHLQQKLVGSRQAKFAEALQALHSIANQRLGPQKNAGSILRELCE